MSVLVLSGTTNLILSLAVVALAVMLVRGPIW